MLPFTSVFVGNPFCPELCDCLFLDKSGIEIIEFVYAASSSRKRFRSAQRSGCYIMILIKLCVRAVFVLSLFVQIAV